MYTSYLQYCSCLPFLCCLVSLQYHLPLSGLFLQTHPPHRSGLLFFHFRHLLADPLLDLEHPGGRLLEYLWHPGQISGRLFLYLVHSFGSLSSFSDLEQPSGSTSPNRLHPGHFGFLTLRTFLQTLLEPLPDLEQPSGRILFTLLQPFTHESALMPFHFLQI